MVRCALSMADLSSQVSDVSMGAVSDGALDRAAGALVVAVENDRLEDALATTAVRLPRSTPRKHCHARSLPRSLPRVPHTGE